MSHFMDFRFEYYPVTLRKLQRSYKAILFIYISLIYGAFLEEVKAGAFGLREVSAAGEAVSLAGAAAGGAGLGSIYFNPATVTQFDGLQIGANTTLILPYSQLKNQNTSSAGYNTYYNVLGGSASSGNIGLIGNIPSGQITYRLNQDVWLGLSLFVPYGQATKAKQDYVGRDYGSTTKVASAEIEPMIGYQVSDRLSIGAGLRYLDFSARYTSAMPAASAPDQWKVLGIYGDGQAFGFNLGMTYKPWVNTEIGLAYRSETNVRLNGQFFGGASQAASFGGSAALASATLDQPVHMNLRLPQTITLGVKQKMTADWTLLGAFEYVQWSSLKSPQVTYAQSGSTLAANWSAGQSHMAVPSIPLYYRDAWFVSAGSEYRYNQTLLLRSGLGYEKTPLGPNASSTRLPDFNRIWASLGLSYALSPQWTVDVAYLHIFLLGDHLSIDKNSTGYSPALANAGLGTLNAKVDAHVDIISLGLTYKFDTGPTRK